MDSYYKDRIYKNLKAFIQQQESVRKGWDDEVQKNYYHQHLSPIISSTAKYADMVDNFLDQLERSKREIDALVGDVFPFYSGTPNERGDITGKSYAIKDNINFINLEYFKNQFSK